MVEPEIYEFLDWVTGIADAFGLVVLPEVHDVFATHERLAAHGFWTYDFVLPGLVLHAFRTRRRTDASPAHLDRSPERQFTTLDCHDGIPVRPDLDGILEPGEMLALAERGASARRKRQSDPVQSRHAADVDVHQLNCTYYSALGEDDDRYIAARAIQLFARGVPQVYYVGLLGGTNDLEAVRRMGDGRAINRHDYTIDEIDEALQRPVVRRLMDLIRLRNTHPAFGGELSVETDAEESVCLRWQHRDAHLSLEVDLGVGRATIVDGDRIDLTAEWDP